MKARTNEADRIEQALGAVQAGAPAPEFPPQWQADVMRSVRLAAADAAETEALLPRLAWAAAGLAAVAVLVSQQAGWDPAFDMALALANDPAACVAPMGWGL